MAIFGSLSTLKNQVSTEKFLPVFAYLEKVMQENSVENQRVFAYPIGASEKIEINENSFAIEQVYQTYPSEDSLFESHKKYIDIQFIVAGEEIIEVENIDNLTLEHAYDEENDFMEYKNQLAVSKLVLRAGDGMILFPEDGHKPCIQLENPAKVIKIVVKLAVE